MLVQIYDWASSVWNMLLSLQGFFTTGIADLLNSIPPVWSAVLNLVFGGLVGSLQAILNLFGLNPSVFSILFSSTGVIALLTVGMVSWALRGS